MAAMYIDLVRSKFTDAMGEISEVVMPGHWGDWERVTQMVESNVKLFDQAYTTFERKYLHRVTSIVQTVLDPVKRLKEFGASIRSEPQGVFRALDEAMMLQRLGILRQMGDFGPKSRAAFSGELVRTARRVSDADEAYSVVTSLARILVDRFSQFCQLMSDPQSSYKDFTPALAENEALRQGVLSLEAIWKPCSVLLNQQALDLLQELDKQLRHPRVGTEGLQLRALRRAALWGRKMFGVLLPTQSVQTSAKWETGTDEELFETLLAVLYVWDLPKDISVLRSVLYPAVENRRCAGRTAEDEQKNVLLSSLRSELKRATWNLAVPGNEHHWNELMWYIIGGRAHVKQWGMTSSDQDLVYCEQVKGKIKELTWLSPSAREVWVAILCAAISENPSLLAGDHPLPSMVVRSTTQRQELEIPIDLPRPGSARSRPGSARSRPLSAAGPSATPRRRRAGAGRGPG